MKILVNLVRIVLGLLFIFGGILIFIDPVGIAYNLHANLSPEFPNLDNLSPYLLAVTVFVGIIQIIFGLMLFLGYVPLLTCGVLFLSAVLFSFWGFHYAHYDHITDYGDFRQLLPFGHWSIFYISLGSVFLLLFLLFKTRYITRIFKITPTKWIIFTVFVFSLGLTYRGIMCAPVIDFSPVRVGNNFYSTLQKGMPWNDLQSATARDLIPLSRSEIQTGIILNKDHILLVVSPVIDLDKKQAWKAVKKITDKALKKDYEVIGLSSSVEKTIDKLADKYHLRFEFRSTDKIDLKMLIRSNPGVLTLYKGKITQKAHWNELDELRLD